jgi:dTDP-4-dehydrorhamnose reductase
VFSREAGQVAPEEDSARTPLNAYARQKARAEDLVADASHGEALVVRTNFFGWSRVPGRGLAAWGLQELRGGRRIQGFTDVFFNPLYVGDVIDLLIGLFERDIRGTVHVLGSQCLSKFSFLRKLATAFWLDPELVEERRLRDAGLAAPRPLNTCLSTTQLERCLGSPPPNVDEGLDRMVQDEEPLRAKLINIEAYPREGEG